MDLEDHSISHLPRLLESCKKEYLEQGDAVDQVTVILAEHPENLETAVIIYEEENKGHFPLGKTSEYLSCNEKKRVTQPVLAIGIAIKDENKNPRLTYTEKYKDNDFCPYLHICKLPLERLLSYIPYIPARLNNGLHQHDSKKEIP